MTDPWIRNGIVQRILDGDSLVIRVDLGYRVYHETRIRLLGIDSPERGQAGWTEARENLGLLAPVGAICVVQTTGPDKYGDRWLGTVQVGGIDLSEAQLVGGFAVLYGGGAR